MANTIKQKRGTTDPGASDLVVGELAINTTDGGVFTKTDGGTVVEVGSGGGGGGASAINDLSDAVTYDSGVSVGLGTGALTNSSGTDQNNTALGYNAGLDITSGSKNVVLGYTAGRDITTASGNIAIGNVLNNSAGVTGGYSVAIGENCGEKLTTGNNNVFIGTNAGEKITTGLSNVFIGDNCGSGPATVTENTFVGRQAGSGNTGSRGVCLGGQAGTSVSGNYNTIIGYQAAYNVSLSGTNNIILGYGADASTTSVSNEITLGDANITSLRIPGLQSGASDGQVLTFDSTNGNITLADAGGFLTEDVNKNIYGGSNTFLNPTLTGSDKADNNLAIGERAMMDITGGDRNVALGQNTMKEITMGMYNVGIGQDACGGNSAAAFTGEDNVGIGRGALEKITTGDHNVALGYKCLENCTTGSYNIALGENTLKDTTTGEYNIALGEGSQRYASGSNNISMGYRTGHNISGSNNTLIGPSILTSSTDSLSGSNNTLIGRGASPSSASVNNEITLGNASITSFRIPGLQSGASDGQVLTYSSTNGNITLADAGGGGASAINDLSDAVTKDSGVTIGLGTGALANDDDTDNDNTALGYNAGNATTSGSGNVFVGHDAGSSRTTIGGATCVGFEAGQYPTSYHTTAVGYQALKGASGTNTSLNNTAVGYQAGKAVSSSGSRNTFMGYYSGQAVTSGVGNVVLGSRSGVSLTTGSNNVLIGYEACGDGSGQLSTGSNNIVIGKHAKSSSSTSSNEITLGNTDITSLRIPGLQSGATDEDVLTYDSTNGNITLKPKSVLSTSAITSGDHNADFTGISTDWVSIEVTFENLSTSNTNNVVLQVGTSSGFVESGYDSHCGRIGTTGVSGGVNTVGFSALIGGDAHTLTGTFILTKIATGGTNVMVMASLTGSRNDNDTSFHGHGFVEISTSTGIDRVRITPSGSDNFDKDGTVNVRVFY